MSPSALIVAPSGPVPAAELEQGIARLTRLGWSIKPSPALSQQNFLFAGDDATRANAFWDAAWNESTDVLWCARGGYGAVRILPELERRTLAEGTPPPKLLCGFSDITALHEFVRSRWGWSSLHCAMPGTESFLSLEEADFAATIALATQGQAALTTTPPTWISAQLHAVGPEPLNDLVGTLVGGNLTVLASLVGTPFAADNAGGRLLYIEDVSEAPYRLDRCLQQLRYAGTFRGVRALILGTFHNCFDSPPTFGPQQTPVRPKYEPSEWLRRLFGEFSRATRIPVLHTLPCGHGPLQSPLPLGASYKLTGAGRLEMLKWDWKAAPNR